jgi:hypothetical protein
VRLVEEKERAERDRLVGGPLREVGVGADMKIAIGQRAGGEVFADPAVQGIVARIA